MQGEKVAFTTIPPQQKGLLVCIRIERIDIHGEIKLQGGQLQKKDLLRKIIDIIDENSVSRHCICAVEV